MNTLRASAGPLLLALLLVGGAGDGASAQTIPVGSVCTLAAAKMVCVQPTSAPTISPTAPPTAAPTVKPTTAPAGGYVANANDPPPSWTAYAQASVWNTKIPANPKLASYSAAVVARQFPGGSNPDTARANEAGQYDYAHPRFIATTNDLLLTVKCTQYCAAGVPARMYVPPKARPAGGGDGHFDVVQPDGTEITAWGCASPDGSYHNYPARNWQTGDAVTCGAIVNGGSIATGPGYVQSNGPTAAGYNTVAGTVTAAELIAGQINHATFIVGACAIGAQYPSEPGASTDPCTSGVGPPLGGREWYDVPCATTQANGALRPWEKAVLCALNTYGAYLGDDYAGGATFTGGLFPQVESEEPWYDFNGGALYVSPFAALAAQGWSAITIPNAMGALPGTRWFGADPWALTSLNLAQHIHWLDACVTQKTC